MNFLQEVVIMKLFIDNAKAYVQLSTGGQGGGTLLTRLNYFLFFSAVSSI